MFVYTRLGFGVQGRDSEDCVVFEVIELIFIYLLLIIIQQKIEHLFKLLK